MTIFEAIGAVMKDCGYIGKNSLNPQQHYKFRGIDAVMNALNPALIKNHVFVVPEVLDHQREERTTAKGGLLIYSVCKVKYTFYADDGSSVSATVVGEGMDSGDKATNKAMSAAFKYACFQTFCIPTEEMKDSEDDSPEPMPRDVTGETIGTVKAAALLAELSKAGVEPRKLLELYKVPTLESLTERQHRNIRDNWAKVVERCAAKVAAEAIAPAS